MTFIKCQNKGEKEMFCNKCGKEIMDDAVICVHCGCAVKKEEPVAPAPAKKKPNVMCIVGFVLGCVSWLLALWGTVAIAGLILSIVGLNQAKSRDEGLKGLGIAGICVSAVSLAYTVYVLIIAAMILGAL